MIIRAALNWILVSLMAVECSDICRMQMYLLPHGQRIDERSLFDMNSSLAQTNVIELDSSKPYQIVCVTGEKVRLRNVLLLEWTNVTTQRQPGAKFQLANQTHNTGEFSYLSAGLLLDSMIDHKRAANLSLLCRFIPADPSIYCEKVVHLKIYSEYEFKLSILLIFCVGLFLAGLLTLTLKLYLKSLRRALGSDDDQMISNLLPAVECSTSKMLNTYAVNNNTNSTDTLRSNGQIQTTQIKIEISEKIEAFKNDKTPNENEEHGPFAFNDRIHTTSIIINGSESTQELNAPINERLID